MEFPYQTTVALTPAEAFARLRHLPRLYPAMHPAHEPHPPGYEPPLLGPDVAFTVAERFGLERRIYDFRVVHYDEPATSLRLEAEARTLLGPLRIATALTVAWSIAPAPEGALVHVVQRVRLRRPWLAPVLLPPAACRKIQAHVDEESRNIRALLTAPEWGS